MPIDPRIALGVQAPQIESPMNVMAKAMQLQGMQRENALFERQQAALLRKQQEEAALNEAYSNALVNNKVDPALLANRLARLGFGSAIPGAQKAVAESSEAQTKARGAELEQARTNRNTYYRAMLAVANDPDLTAEKAATAARALAAANIVNPDMVEQGIAHIAQMGGDPDKIRAIIVSGANQSMTDEQMQSVFSTPLEFRSLGGGVGGFDKFGRGLRTFTPNRPMPADVEAQEARLGPARAPRVNVNAVDTATEAAMKAFITELKDRRSQLVSSPTTIENLQQARTLINDARNFVGAGGEPLLQAAKFLNNRLGFGIDTKGVTKAEELRSRLFNGVLENLRKLDAQPTAQQQLVLQQSIGSLETDPDALPKVIGVWEDIVRSKVESYNADVASAEEQGVRFPYKAKIELPPRAAAEDESVEVNVPGRGPVRFPNKKAADDFKKAAGL